MGLITRAFHYTGTPSETDWNVDVDALFSLVNGSLDNTNITLTGDTGLMDLATAQTATGRKTLSGGMVLDELLTVAAAGAGLVKLADFRYDPASGTSTDNDGFYVSLMGDDDNATPNETEYARWGVRFTDTGDGSEDGEQFWGVMTAGTLATELWLSGAALYPNANAGLALGTTSLGYNGLHLGTGTAINWANGEITITETSADVLTIAGIATRLDLAAGILEMNNAIEWDSGVAVVAAEYSVGRDADGTNQLHFNVPTGAKFEWSIQDAMKANLSATGLGIGVTAGFMLHGTTGTSGAMVRLINSHASTPSGSIWEFSGAAPDNNTQYFLNCQDTGADRLIIYADGDVVNHDNSYGAISDESLKQDIEDAREYWDDWKKLKFRKFRFKSDVAADNDCAAMFGVIAQELEEVFPGMVQEDGTTGLKGVKYSILSQIGLKVVQELQARVEALEAA